MDDHSKIALYWIFGAGRSFVRLRRKTKVLTEFGTLDHRWVSMEKYYNKPKLTQERKGKGYVQRVERVIINLWDQDSRIDLRSAKMDGTMGYDGNQGRNYQPVSCSDLME